ncbi:unnamed protein product [Heligmosomoides polygyrus]|uniref:Separase n=1 Tax=Heligmosomoides polygyrus TaxID=6339 RepID=A0A183FLF6_HELPZ|nr:unnamed protein product [Heligmosomoides polygyrus]
MHVNVAQLAKLIRGYLFPMGCGVVEEENLLEALRMNKSESPAHLFYFVPHGLGRGNFSDELHLTTTLTTHKKAIWMPLASCTGTINVMSYLQAVHVIPSLPGMGQ